VDVTNYFLLSLPVAAVAAALLAQAVRHQIRTMS
jgi:hypothetical protein